MDAHAPLIEPCDWIEARAGLDETLLPDVADIEDQVERNVVQLWRVNGGDLYLATRAELWLDRSELVVLAAKGRGLREAWAVIARRAKAQGMDSVRFHTKRPALGRLMREWGFELDQYVYKAAL